MKLLGAEVVPVKSGTRTLKDAMNEALRDWVANVENTFYIIGTVAGPHPYPTLVRDFQSIIGQEVRWQMEEAEGRLPDSLVVLRQAVPPPTQPGAIGTLMTKLASRQPLLDLGAGRVNVKFERDGVVGIQAGEKSQVNEVERRQCEDHTGPRGGWLCLLCGAVT